MPAIEIPRDAKQAVLDILGRQVKVTNTGKLFWPERGITKGDLIQYYVDVSEALLPHVRDRAMVMRRYPDGIAGQQFFMKRAPAGKPDWVATHAITHSSGNVIDFPVVNDLASLVWIVNLGCIDLNQWYARTDDVDRPDYLHFDLDPGDATWEQVRQAALVLHRALDALKMPNYVKTSGSKGIHLYVPIERGPHQKDVWRVAKALAWELAGAHPDLLTAVYKRADRPKGRVLVDYNQNRWGSTLASVYSVRPTKTASVSTPVTWDELAAGVAIDDFRLDNVPARVRAKGDLWAPLAPDAPGRFKLEPPAPPPKKTRAKAPPKTKKKKEEA